MLERTCTLISFRKEIADFRNPSFKNYSDPLFDRARKIDEYIIELEHFVSEFIYLNNDKSDPKTQMHRFKENYQSMIVKHSQAIAEQKEYLTQNSLPYLYEHTDTTLASSIGAQRDDYFYHEQLFKYKYYVDLCNISMDLSFL